jgi:hypothetical protein
MSAFVKVGRQVAPMVFHAHATAAPNNREGARIGERRLLAEKLQFSCPMRDKASPGGDSAREHTGEEQPIRRVIERSPSRRDAAARDAHADVRQWVAPRPSVKDADDCRRPAGYGADHAGVHQLRRQGRIGFHDAPLAHLYQSGKVGLAEGW